LMQLQLNVHRLVVVYRVPAREALDAATLAVRLDRWRIGAEHAGWKFGWRDAPHYVETYCYAFAGPDFLEDEQQQLSRRRAAATLLAYRHRPDDALLYARGRPMRHPPVAAPCRVPRLAARHGSRASSATPLPAPRRRLQCPSRRAGCLRFREIDYCPARTGDFMIFSKPGDGFLYVFATFRANRRQHIVVDNTGWPRFRS
jgi:hypothetical protein